MLSGPGGRPRRRIAVELVEADVEIGFNLVDLSWQEFQSGRPSAAARVLHDADGVLQDMELRLARLDPADRASFAPLVAELRREVNHAKARTSSSAA